MRKGLPAFCLGRDSGRILARALVLFGADAVELFKRPAEVGAVLVPHRHGNVPDFLPAAQQQANPYCSTFSWRRKTRHAEAAPTEPARCFKTPQREPALRPSWVLPTAPRASGVGKNHRGRDACTIAGTFPIKHIHIPGNSMLTTSYTYAINGGREGRRQDGTRESREQHKLPSGASPPGCSHHSAKPVLHRGGAGGFLHAQLCGAGRTGRGIPGQPAPVCAHRPPT